MSKIMERTVTSLLATFAVLAGFYLGRETQMTWTVMIGVQIGVTISNVVQAWWAHRKWVDRFER